MTLFRDTKVWREPLLWKATKTTYSTAVHRRKTACDALVSATSLVDCTAVPFNEARWDVLPPSPKPIRHRARPPRQRRRQCAPTASSNVRRHASTSRFWLAEEASGLTERAMANCDPLTATCGSYAGMRRRLASEHPLPRRWSSLTAATERTRVRHAFSCRLSLLLTF